MLSFCEESENTQNLRMVEDIVQFCLEFSEEFKESILYKGSIWNEKNGIGHIHMVHPI